MSCTEVGTGHHICAVEEASRVPHSARVSVGVEIIYELEEGGWVIASIPQVPGVHSQGNS